MAEEDGVLRQKKIWAEVQVFIDELEQQGIPIPVHSLEAFEVLKHNTMKFRINCCTESKMVIDTENSH